MSEHAAVPLHVGFVLEQTLGHRTHADNLARLIPRDERVVASFLPVEFPLGRWERLIPGYGNWTVRAGVRAGRALRQGRHDHGPFDVLFVHSQVPAMLNRRWMSAVPTVISLDATPRQYDDLAVSYGHGVGSERAEALKERLHRACFARAAHLVTWSEWARADLGLRYGVDPERVTVIPPGVVNELWAPPDRPHERRGAVRVLFVGGDLERKGGLDLLEAYRALRGAGRDVELHLVTSADIADEPGVTVHRGLTPNDSRLVELYHRSDVFCLPTHGDCLPMVLSEAAAAGLAMISTDVGAIREVVRDEETGVLVPVRDQRALHAALERLVHDAPLRRHLGERASALARERLDAGVNARRLVELLVEVAHRASPAASR